jgi:hypothetical protein
LEKYFHEQKWEIFFFFSLCLFVQFSLRLVHTLPG